MAKIDIMWKDLSDEKRAELFMVFNEKLSLPQDMNWDTIPVATIEIDDEIIKEIKDERD